MHSFLNVITLQTYTFFKTLTPRLHGRSKRFFRRPQNLNAPRIIGLPRSLTGVGFIKFMELIQIRTLKITKKKALRAFLPATRSNLLNIYCRKKLFQTSVVERPEHQFYSRQTYSCKSYNFKEIFNLLKLPQNLTCMRVASFFFKTQCRLVGQRG